MMKKVPNCCEVHRPWWREQPTRSKGMSHQFQVWGAVHISWWGHILLQHLISCGEYIWIDSSIVHFLRVGLALPKHSSLKPKADQVLGETRTELSPTHNTHHLPTHPLTKSHLGRLVESGLVDLWMKEMGEKAKQENKKRIREGGACLLFLIPHLNIPTYTLCITQLHTLLYQLCQSRKGKRSKPKQQEPDLWAWMHCR